VKSGIWPMFCISKTRADRGKLVVFLESAGQIYPETGLTFEAPKCVLAGVIILVYIQQDATLHSLFISGNCSTCFGWYRHPSSGAQTTVSTASGICHTVMDRVKLPIMCIRRYKNTVFVKSSWTEQKF
jgi:hypothetical protein